MSYDLQPGPQAAVEFHDSTIASIEVDGNNIVVRFKPACVHHSTGVPGVDAGTVWTQKALMIVCGCRTSGSFPQEAMKLADGMATVGSRFYDNVIPVPLSVDDKVRVNFSFENGFVLEFEGESIHLELDGSAEFLEEFSGSWPSPKSTDSDFTP